jgi:beta-phosphoglucomutase
MPTPIRGFIFDLDGVLTDTSEYHYLGWQRLCDEEGIPFDRQKGEHLRGIGRMEALRWILGDRDVSPEQFAEMAARKNGYYKEYVEQMTPDNLLPGARALLEETRAAGIKIAVASASKNAPRVIELLQIGPLLDAVTDGYSVNRTKPEPDVFIHAAGQLRLPVSQCVVFEDATSGVAAGKTAGMRVVGLGPPERVGAADVVLGDLDGVRLTTLLGALRNCSV